MILSAHVAVGSAVGLATRNPILGFFAGFIFHHLMDAVPHSDLGSLGGNLDTFKSIKHWWLIIFGDVLLALVIFMYIFYKSDFMPAVFWGAVGCVVSDIIDNIPIWSPALRKFFPFNCFNKFHDFFHFTIENKKYLWVGIATQIAVIIISIAYVLMVA